jgi:HEAT repeat protein
MLKEKKLPRNQKAVDTMMDTLMNGSLYDQVKAVDALGRAGDLAVTPLMSALRSPDVNVRWGIAMALAKVGEPAVPALMEAMKDEVPTVKNPAVWALAEIGDPRAMEPLKQIFREEQDEITRALTAAALLKMMGPIEMKELCLEIAGCSDQFRDVVLEAYLGT